MFFNFDLKKNKNKNKLINTQRKKKNKEIFKSGLNFCLLSSCHSA